MTKNNVEKVKFKYNKITGTFRNELGQEKSMVEANISNEVAATIARRKKHYMEDLWKIDPKKKGPQYVGIRNFTYPEDDLKQKPKKVIPKVDVASISKGISNYMALTKKEKPIQRPEFLDKKFRDPDMDKGLGSLVPKDKNLKK